MHGNDHHGEKVKSSYLGLHSRVMDSELLTLITRSLFPPHRHRHTNVA